MSSSQPAPISISELDQIITRPTELVLSAIDHTPGDFIVLGAGGKMGFHISRMLQRGLQELGRQSNVIVVSRFSSLDSRETFGRLGFDVVAADLSDPDQLANVPLAENVIYLAGVKFGTSSAADLLQRMNVVMPKLVAEHYRDSRIVALSTGCVYSFTAPESGGSTEDSATVPPGEYAQSCLERERAFVGGSRLHATRCALVRLNYSIDLRYGVLVDIAQQVKAGTPVDVTTGFVNVIWQGDAVAQILQCLPLADSPPMVINVTGSETLAVRELAMRFADRFGCVAKFSGSEAATCWLNNSARARELFGEPRVSAEQLTAWIADWIDRGGETLGKPTQFQRRDGNY